MYQYGRTAGKATKEWFDKKKPTLDWLKTNKLSQEWAENVTVNADGTVEVTKLRSQVPTDLYAPKKDASKVVALLKVIEDANRI